MPGDLVAQENPNQNPREKMWARHCEQTSSLLIPVGGISVGLAAPPLETGAVLPRVADHAGRKTWGPSGVSLAADTVDAPHSWQGMRAVPFHKRREVERLAKCRPACLYWSVVSIRRHDLDMRWGWWQQRRRSSSSGGTRQYPVQRRQTPKPHSAEHVAGAAVAAEARPAEGRLQAAAGVALGGHGGLGRACCSE